MRWRRFSRLHQGAIQDSAKFAQREGPIHLLTVDEHGGSSFHAQRLALVDGTLDFVVLLRFDAGLGKRARMSSL